MAHWPAFSPTRFPEIGLTQCAPDLWRWLDTETAAIVGPQYRTKAEALADLERYAFENWGLGTRPTADPVREAAPDLLAALIDAVAMLEVYTDPRGSRVNASTAGQARSTIRDARAAIAKAEGR